MGKGLDKSSSHKISNIIKRGAKSGLGQSKCKSWLPKGRAGMQVFFSSPVVGHVFSIMKCKMRVSSMDGQGLIQL